MHHRSCSSSVFRHSSSLPYKRLSRSTHRCQYSSQHSNSILIRRRNTSIRHSRIHHSRHSRIRHSTHSHTHRSILSNSPHHKPYGYLHCILAYGPYSAPTLPYTQASLPPLYPPPQSGYSSQVHVQQPSSDITKNLKKVSIPTFSGNKREYDRWKAAFVVCVDKQPLSKEMKLLQLRQYLNDEALKVVESLGFSPSSYDAALRRLEQRYGGQRRQIAVHVEELEEFNQIRTAKAADLERFADLLEVAIVQMTDAGLQSELGIGTMYTRLQQKLATPILTQYHRWVLENSKHESVRTLQEWVNREAAIIATATETVDGVSGSSSNSSS
eukprot:scpid83758/ scgid26711/ 